jgi:6-pyruvoyltetrahydropterin/6-carboxytetrahydropterin synthase
LKVTVAGTPDDETGYVIDLSTLKAIINTQIVEKCDHKNLNLDVDFLDGVLPSTENLVKSFYEQLKNPVREATNSNGFLYEIELEETERNSARYCPYLLEKQMPVID